MKNIIKIFLTAVLIFSLNGCLLFHKVYYDVTLDQPGKGTAKVTFYDIRSDAKTSTEFEQDKNNIFTFIPSSDEFLTEIQKEGKNFISRQLYVVGDTLDGKGVFKFDSIKAVEGIMLEDGFYYMTLELGDSVIYTNGEIINSKEYKRIIWGENEKNLKFEIFSTDFSEGNYRKLAQFYKK